MPRPARVADESTRRRRPPALTIEGREAQIVAKAMDLAEKQIDNETISAQVLAHFVKIGSSNYRLEKERLEQENKLLRARTDALESSSRIEALYSEAIKAMRTYGGHSGSEEEEEDDG